MGKVPVMDAEDSCWRRELARTLTRRARASAAEILDESISFGGAARRIGITGPPGAGKSSLIAMLAEHWALTASKVGVMAIDPTSPLSGGSLLGDRIRMDEVAENPNLFIRSLSSGSAHDGLCPNISPLLDAFEQADFEYLILETVGVGQVSYAARSLVDTLVLVLVPESGDTVQAMKAGILEVADIYVVNKADLPAAARLATELRAIAGWRARHSGWVPPVILTSSTEMRGARELATVIQAHRDAVLNAERMRTLAVSRREFHLRSLFLQRVEEMLTSHRAELQDATTRESFRLILDRLGNGGPMSLEQNKQTAREFLAASAIHDADRLAALMTDDATYWVQGKAHLFPYSGEKTKAEICKYFQTPSIFKDGLTQTIGAVTAEENRVAVEVEVSGVAPSGKLYNNTFHYLFIFRDGRIARVKEYVDTYHAAEVFCR